MQRLIDLGVLPVRRHTASGIAPHISILFRKDGPKLFGIDTTPAHSNSNSNGNANANGNMPSAYFITHAHSDHYGRSAMRSERAVASNKTARALEIRCGREFAGKTFSTGEIVCVDGVEVKTFDTYHTIGSSAFFWENEAGTKILATGDVKDFSALPKCDVLIMEATYGDPFDRNCCFDEELDHFKNAICGEVAFGAYSFGKAQRAVQLLREFGYRDCIEMSEEAFFLTKQLMDGAEPIAMLGEKSSGLCVVSPRDLDSLSHPRKFILTAQSFYRHGRIKISDHLDFRGLLQMVRHCSPEFVIVYHPASMTSAKFAQYLNNNGLPAISTCEIDNILEERIFGKFY